ncbi:MAG TPA: Uma2 family endonuclease [Gemmatimonadaceae bacterium]|nr:Uma2 family endonuclease [Gemmatimonadaceae bacterium]
MTSEELEMLYIPGKRTELLRGQLVVREPPGTEHGRISASLAYFIIAYVRQHGLGEVFAQDTGFKIESGPDTVRAPDVAFLARDRAGQVPRRGHAPVAPDLIVEIVSPGDAPSEVLAKVAAWLGAGVRLALRPALVRARRGCGALSCSAWRGRRQHYLTDSSRGARRHPVCFRRSRTRSCLPGRAR